MVFTGKQQSAEILLKTCKCKLVKLPFSEIWPVVDLTKSTLIQIVIHEALSMNLVYYAAV